MTHTGISVLFIIRFIGTAKSSAILLSIWGYEKKLEGIFMTSATIKKLLNMTLKFNFKLNLRIKIIANNCNNFKKIKSDC